MSTFKRILCIVFISVLCLGNAACKSTSPGLQAFPSMEEKGFVKATVKNYTVDGCTWMLFSESGKKLQPAKLDAAFQKNDLPVWIQYTVKKGATGICMAGEIVDITAIELR